MPKTCLFPSCGQAGPMQGVRKPRNNDLIRCDDCHEGRLANDRARREILAKSSVTVQIEVDSRIYAEARIMAGKNADLTGAIALAIAVQTALQAESHCVHLVEDELNTILWSVVFFDESTRIHWHRISECAFDWLNEERRAREASVPGHRKYPPWYTGTVEASPSVIGQIADGNALKSLGFAWAIPDPPERTEKGQLSLFES